LNSPIAGFFDGKRVEFVRGEIIDRGRQGWPHAAALDLVVEALRHAFPLGYWVGDQKPFPVGNSEPIPDAAVILGSPRDYQDHPTAAALIVEVADSTLHYDLTTKAELYATAGVAEYWVLDLEHRQLHVLRDPQRLSNELEAVAYQSHTTLNASDTIAPIAASTACIKVSDLLP
jgi:Uma2 family endonuclease